MITAERRHQIIHAIESDGTVSVQDLATRFNVSTMTIRRDLRTMEHEGLVRRVHGGAITPRGRGYEPPFALRAGQQVSEKERIAARAAELVAEGDTLVLDVGTTVLELARRLRMHSNLTVLVTSLQAANELASHPGIRLIVAGGVVRFPELSLAGSLTERMLNEFYLDKAFIGASGVSMDGTTGFNLEDALVTNVIIQRAKHCILLADHTKFDQVAFRRAAPLSNIETIVTGAETDPNIVQKLQDNGVNVLLA